MTTQNQVNSSIAGKVLVYSIAGIPKVGIPYGWFDQAAEFCKHELELTQDEAYGMPREFMPKVGEEIAHAQNAWALGTGDFPAKGAKIDPPQEVKNFYFAKYGVQPLFRVRVIRHKKTPGSDVVKRHLYLDVYTATAGADTDESIPDDLNQITKASKEQATKAAEKQLTNLPIILMEFAIQVSGKERLPVMRFTTTDNVDEALLPYVKTLVAQMKEKVRRMKENSNDQAIRAGVRNWLYANSCFAVRGSGGNYFLPMMDRKTNPDTGAILEHSTDEKIDGLICYFDQLVDFCDQHWAKVLAENPNAKVPQERPEIMVLDAMRSSSGSLHSKRTTVSLMDKAAENVNDRLESVLEDLKPVLTGQLGDKAAAKRVRDADEEILRIFRSLNSYKDAFDEKFERLNAIVELADERISEAKKQTSLI